MNHFLRGNNYLYVPGFISVAQAHSLGGMFIDHVNSTGARGDPQAPNSPSVYDFHPFVRLMVKKLPWISEYTQLDLLPTYTYARVYATGEILERHRDRPACELSVTLNLRKDADWPIWFQRPDGTETSVELNPGDAVIYQGCISDHWRREYTGRQHVQLFMHYVNAMGDFAPAYFDKNKLQ
jgi:hypothetical protein